MLRFQIIARSLQFLSIFGTLFVLAQPVIVTLAALAGTNTVNLGEVVFRAAPDMTIWKAFLGLLPNAIVAIGLGYLSRFGQLLATGANFDHHVSDSLQKAAILFIIGVMLSWIVEPFIATASFAAAFIQLLENHGLLLLISLAFSLIAMLLRQARAIEVENEEFY